MEKQLRERIAELERENRALLERNRILESQATQLTRKEEKILAPTDIPLEWECNHDLTKHQVERYGRQLVLPVFGPQAQDRLSKAKVLVIGAGGLGSSALMYLAAAGVGIIGIVDRDEVSLSNLHRQVIHRERCVGMLKTNSAQQMCTELNSSVSVKTYSDGLMPRNAVEIIAGYDVVIDASDNVPTRYLISDACAVLRVPLVSGAAIGTDGQLTVYNYGTDGPCYRCLFPKAPPAAACSSCSEAGVLGPVPGTIGVLQALEAIKIVSKVGTVMSKRILVFDFLNMDFRQVKLRSKRDDCICCGLHPHLTAANLAQYDYMEFTGQPFCEMPETEPNEKVPPSARLTPAELSSQANTSNMDLIILDVRPAVEFQICHFKDSISFPFDKMESLFPSMIKVSKQRNSKEENANQKHHVVVVCRRGNDSQTVVNRLQREGLSNVKDLIGGLESWHHLIDPTFLMY